MNVCTYVYICICMYVRAYIRMSICIMYVYMYTCMYARTYVYMYHVGIYVCITFICRYVRRYVFTFICMYVCRYVRWGADKSLARPTSRCRWAESILSLERGVCSCAELQSLFLLQRLKGSMSGEERDFNNIRTPAVINFFYPARQGAEENSRNSHTNIRGT